MAQLGCLGFLAGIAFILSLMNDPWEALTSWPFLCLAILGVCALIEIRNKYG